MNHDETFYWLDDNRIDADGTISMPVSGYSEKGAVPWNGRFSVSPGEDDYLFWAWFITDPARCKTLAKEAEIQKLKATFAKG